jgi:hypothetical protein
MIGGEMSCRRVQRMLPGYLDGAMSMEAGRPSHAAIHAHISGCGDCRAELSRYQRLQQMLAQTERVAPPVNLGVEIRMALARAREVSSPEKWFGKLRDKLWLVGENILAPLALPAAGGLAAALMIFSVVLPSYARVAPMQSLGGWSDDMQTASFQPARLEQLADFSVSDLNDEDSKLGSMILVEATVGVDGSVVDYQILAGPSSAGVRRQLDQILLFSRFRPQVSFGRPISGGRVVMSFSTVNVKG